MQINQNGDGIIDSLEPLKQYKSESWGLAGTLLWCVTITIIYFFIQIIISIVYIKCFNGDDNKEAMASIQHNGMAVSFALFGASVLCSLILFYAIKLKKFSNLKDYLALNKISLNKLKYWILIAIMCVLMFDCINYVLGIPIVPEYFRELQIARNNMWLLFVAAVIAAPIFEEIFFRGFLFYGLSRTYIGAIGAAVVTSTAWAGIHVQYGLYENFSIFVMGLLLCFARHKTNSILTSMLMHSSINLLAMVEMLYF
ncbi:MAG: CPBP family intramembrane metalloprotease [Burkholderiales bacterium]|nr:CPBP family intramembrane metalloprotease [Burkholderiales bacterium]